LNPIEGLTQSPGAIVHECSEPAGERQVIPLSPPLFKAALENLARLFLWVLKSRLEIISFF
jgi:hypothetical protein